MASNTDQRPPPRPNLCTGTQPEPEHLLCPRCDSPDTKFCYYNNYNLSQPRHFCKACRRYWTRGGTLRNVPVGGGTRKTPKKRSRDEQNVSAEKMAVYYPIEFNNEAKEMVQDGGMGMEMGLVPYLNTNAFGFTNGFTGFGNGENGNGSGEMWQVGGAEGENFGWPDLAISSLGWGNKEYYFFPRRY